MFGKLFIITAPSGAGKSSLSYRVIKELSHAFAIEKSVTYTTRAPRKGEVCGKDYLFISLEDFQIKLESGFFLETSQVYDHFYGSSNEIIIKLSLGISLIIILDPRGVKVVKQKIPEAIAIWIYPPKSEELKLRIMNRDSSINESELGKRLDNLFVDEFSADDFDYQIYNENFYLATEELKKIIIKNLE